MLIHQDLTVRGGGPLIEIFDNRVEFSNPGSSLIRLERLVNDPPEARNPKLADLSRRLGMCEKLDPVGIRSSMPARRHISPLP